MTPSKRSNSIKEYYFSQKLAEIKKLEEEGKFIINLGIGSPDLPPHATVGEILKSEILQPNAFKYQPYKGIEGLRTQMLDWYTSIYEVQLSDAFISIPLLGSKEGIHFLALAYLNPGDKALIPNPGYPAYSSAIQLAGGVPVKYSLTQQTEWHPSIKELETLVTDKTKVMFINYPHMPTGQNPNPEILSELMHWAQKRDILICNDNPYSQILTQKPFSIFQLKGAVKNCVELNSLSKSSSMAGARVGMISGESKLLNPIFKIQTSFSSGMFKPIQMAAIEALLRSKEQSQHINKVYQKRRNLIWKLLDNLECQYSKTNSGMFVWASYKNHMNSFEFSDWLLQEYGLFLTPGEVFGSEGKGYIRASLCAHADEILTAINRIIPKT